MFSVIKLQNYVTKSQTPADVLKITSVSPGYRSCVLLRSLSHPLSSAGSMHFTAFMAFTALFQLLFPQSELISAMGKCQQNYYFQFWH